MAYSDALKNFRKGDYGDDGQEGEGSGPSTARVINLTDEEAKELQGYQDKYGPGEEIVIEATGKVEGDHFHIMSVKYAEGKGGNSDDAAAVMEKMRGPNSPSPMMQMQTQPSPS